MCLHDYFKTFSKICILGVVLVFCVGSNSVQSSEPLRIVTNSDRYPNTSGPFLAVKATDQGWVQPIKFASIKYVGVLPDDAVLSQIGYYSPSTGKAYFYVADARSIYVPGPTGLIASSVNNHLDEFGLSTVLDRQKQIDAVRFKAPDLVDSSTLWPKILTALSVWVLSGLVLGLPVLVVIFGWRRLFQLFLIRELGKTIRGRVDDGRKD